MPSNRRALLAASNAGGPFDVYYLVVAGGGGAATGNTADEAGGGGGAGGLLTNYPSSPYEIETGTAYTVTVGAGGAGGTNSSTNGGNSVFDSFTATGGGAGDDNVGAFGGSGGGAGADDTTDSNGGNGTVGQGNDGGDSAFLGEYGVAGGGGGAGAAGSAGVRTDGSYMAMLQVTPSTADFNASTATKGIASNQPYSIPLPSGVGASDFVLMTLFGDANGGGLTTPAGWTALSNFTNLGDPDIYGGVFVYSGNPGTSVTVNDAINSRQVSYMCHRIVATSINAGEFSDSSNGQLAGDSTSNRCHTLTVAHEADSLRAMPTDFIANNSVTGSGFATSQRMGFDRSNTTDPIYAGDVGNAGDGGDGTSNSITGTAVTYAGGGGGGDASQTGSGSTGGTGGGGNGGGTSTAGQDGTANTGGGGGGSATNTTGQGDGGSGVVILRFDSARSIASTTGTLAYSTATDGTDTVATFTSGTGTVTFA